MMNLITRVGSYLVLGLALVAAAGCHEIGHIGDTPGDIYGGRQEAEIVGEVRWVDNRLREIEVRGDDGRVKSARYDSRTRVVYRRQEYAATNLEPGDFVAMRIQQSTSGKPYTDLINVRQSVQERGGKTAPRERIERLDGTVEYVDSQRGLFELRDQYGKKVMVTLPYNARRSDVDRLRRLRGGDYVRVEGKFLNPDRFELEAFL